MTSAPRRLSWRRAASAPTAMRVARSACRRCTCKYLMMMTSGGAIAVEKRHRLDCGVGPEIQDGEEEQASRSPRRQMVVDDGPDDEWRHELEGSGGEHEQHDDAGSDAPGPQQACQMAGQRSGFAGVAGIDEDKATHSRAASVGAISALSCAR